MAIGSVNYNSMMSVVGPAFVQAQLATSGVQMSGDTASLSGASAAFAGASSLSSYLSSDGSAISNYLNSSYSSEVLSGSSSLTSIMGDTSTAATAAQAAVDAAGDKGEVSESGKALSSARSSYFKKYFPNMTDEQMASLNAFYDMQFSQYEEQMAAFMSEIGAAAGVDGSGATGAVSASTANMNGTAWGNELAQDAEANANGPGGWCLKWVAQALARHGVNIGGASAYMAADQLAGCSQFKEVSGVADADLSNLPAGAVVVWDHGNGHEHGHICISLGDGREASDKIRNMTHNYGTSYRVFLPNQ